MSEYRMVTGTKVLLVLAGLSGFATLVSLIAVETSGGKPSAFVLALLGLTGFWVMGATFHEVGSVAGQKAAKK